MGGNGHQPKVRFARDGDVGTVTLDSPPLNLIGQELISDLLAAFSQVEAADGLRALVLRNWCHRTGKRYQEVAAPLYRLRSALSRLWQAAPPPGYHLPVLNPG